MIYIFANLLSISGIIFFTIGLLHNEWRFFALGVFLCLVSNNIIKNFENK